MTRKTMRLSEIRAYANRVLAGSDAELTDVRRGVASFYEHLAMAADDYHGYNDIVAVWSGEPGHSTYVEDQTYRRQYYGQMSGPDAEPAERAIKAYREPHRNDGELLRRRAEARQLAMAKAGRPQVLRKDLPLGLGNGWLVKYRSEHFAISTGQFDSGPETQVFRSDMHGQVTDWDAVATAGPGSPQAAMAALEARPVDADGLVMSPRDVLDVEEASQESIHVCGQCGCETGGSSDD